MSLERPKNKSFKSYPSAAAQKRPRQPSLPKADKEMQIDGFHLDPSHSPSWDEASLFGHPQRVEFVYQARPSEDTISSNELGHDDQVAGGETAQDHLCSDEMTFPQPADDERAQDAPADDATAHNRASGKETRRKRPSGPFRELILRKAESHRRVANKLDLAARTLPENYVKFMTNTALNQWDIEDMGRSIDQFYQMGETLKADRNRGQTSLRRCGR